MGDQCDRALGVFQSKDLPFRKCCQRSCACQAAHLRLSRAAAALLRSDRILLPAALQRLECPAAEIAPVHRCCTTFSTDAKPDLIGELLPVVSGGRPRVKHHRCHQTELDEEMQQMLAIPAYCAGASIFEQASWVGGSVVVVA
eukprot:507168-Prymnesium_polylepis.1